MAILSCAMWQLLTWVCSCVHCMCGAPLPYKDSFQSEPRGPPQTAGLISAEISPIFYLLLNIYSRLNPVSPSVSRLTMVGAAAAASNLHIYEMPEVLFSLSANRDANEGLEVRCQSFRVNVDVRHPQQQIKIVTVHSQVVLSRSIEVKWPAIRTQRQCGVVNKAKTVPCCR